MGETLDTDYVVVGAGAAGIAFADALVDHGPPEATLTLVDHRDRPGGHWRSAYPFVRLHQASSFYGVASTVLGGGEIQTEGPEAGLHQRADRDTILAYYDAALARMETTGRVRYLGGWTYAGDRSVASLATEDTFALAPHTRLVDARYLSPDVPATSPPRFAVHDGARVVPVNAVPAVTGAHAQYVVAGSGKTATDTVVRLLSDGVDPDAICWVRPRDPWMLNRAVVQPDPTIYLGMVATMMELAAAATTLDALFLALEDAGIMHRIDRAVTPTMAKAPTLGAWELDLLRAVTHVVRRGHVRSVAPGRLELDEGTVTLVADAVVIDCAADGLKQPPLRPIWGREAITLQPVRAGFPCFGAALSGYVEATRDDDVAKNRLCPPSSFGNSLVDWARMNVLGLRSSAAFGAEPDVAAWANACALNPARIPPDHPATPALAAATGRLREHVGPGVARLAELAGLR